VGAGGVVDGNPAPVAAAEGDLVDAVVGSVGNRGVPDVVVPTDHVGDTGETINRAGFPRG